MKITKNVIIGVILFLTIIFSYSITTAQSDEIVKPDNSIYLTNYLKRIEKIEAKYNASRSPLERYYYSRALIDILNEMQDLLKEANSVYYKPAILMMTGEIKVTDKTTSNNNN